VRVFYADCDCSIVELRAAGFNPQYLAAGPGNEQTAAHRHLASVAASNRGNGPRYFAFHVGGKHIIHVIE
jgi:hypothetical protein